MLTPMRPPILVTAEVPSLTILRLPSAPVDCFWSDKLDYHDTADELIIMIIMLSNGSIGRKL